MKHNCGELKTNLSRASGKKYRIQRRSVVNGAVLAKKERAGGAWAFLVRAARMTTLDRSVLSKTVDGQAALFRMTGNRMNPV